MRFIYRTLAIAALALAAGLTHAWFVPIATSFGGPDPRGERQRDGAGQAVTGEGAQQPIGDETPDPVEQQPAEPEEGSGESETDLQIDPGTGDAGADPQPQESPAAEPPDAPEPIDIDTLGDFIDVPEARAIWRAGNEDFIAFVAFLDARYPEQYAQGHITGARRLLAGEVTSGAGAETLNWLLQQEPDHIVIYCEGGECDASKNLARQLELSGSFTREQLHVLQPGYPAWAEQHPDLTTSGDEPGEP